MGIFSRRDTSALQGAALRGTYDEFVAVYQAKDAGLSFGDSGSLLSMALGNPDPAARVAIATRLLDDGADVTDGDVLHVLLSQREHDFTTEPALLQRLLDAGADVNRSVPKFGVPIETLAEVFKFSDAQLAPFYDVLLARDDLDLRKDGAFRKPVIDSLHQLVAKRADLVARADAYLAQHP